MNARCQCGVEIKHPFERLGCVECGDACCPTCAIPLESATYCRACAASLLDAAPTPAARPFELF